MITIPVQLSDERPQRVMPFLDRLPEIIELGLRQSDLVRARLVAPRRDRKCSALAGAGHFGDTGTSPAPDQRKIFLSYPPENT